MHMINVYAYDINGLCKLLLASDIDAEEHILNYKNNLTKQCIRIYKSLRSIEILLPLLFSNKEEN